MKSGERGAESVESSDEPAPLAVADDGDNVAKWPKWQRAQKPLLPSSFAH